MAEFTSPYDALSPLREIISEYNLAPKKSLGQNFLLDLNVTDKIVKSAQDRFVGDWSDVHAIEIGPGPGGLTRSLLKSGLRRVTAVEYDSRAVAAQQYLLSASQGTLKIIEADALECNLLDLSSAPRIIVANLPYNIATPLLLRWLSEIRSYSPSYESMTLMFQKEVAERICAVPNTKAYGRLSVIAQWLCDVEIVYHLPPQAFTPPPKVESAVVHFRPKVLKSDSPSFNAVEKVTAAAFGQRRKMIRSSLKEYEGVFQDRGIDGTRRAEDLTVREFLDLVS